MKINDKATSAVLRHPDYTDRRLSKIAMTTVTEIRRIRERMGLATPEPHAAPADPPKPRPRHAAKGRSFDDFRAANDVTYIIAETIKRELPDKGPFYYDDHEFREMCGIPVTNWRRHADDTRFKPWRLCQGRHNLWAPAPMISDMKRILGL